MPFLLDGVPPGPPPPAGQVYGYLVVPTLPIVLPEAVLSELSYVYYLLEQDFAMRGVPGERQEKNNGYRIYRTRVGWLWRFASDKQGAYIRIPTSSANGSTATYRFVYSDPSLNLVTTNDWRTI